MPVLERSHCYTLLALWTILVFKQLPWNPARVNAWGNICDPYISQKDRFYMEGKFWSNVIAVKSWFLIWILILNSFRIRIKVKSWIIGCQLRIVQYIIHIDRRLKICVWLLPGLVATAWSPYSKVANCIQFPTCTTRFFRPYFARLRLIIYLRKKYNKGVEYLNFKLQIYFFLKQIIHLKWKFTK